uniref:Thioredoxin domain-containing protein n=1 Tax=Globisporangium ultimum (strain ATCC 200006 / CBS 805.95 / DAOM BR144) TaxID=431595 RepID=K3WD81_GLOUD
MASHEHEHNSGGACCSAGHDHHHDGDGDNMDFMHDPTLASCCERDQQQYEKAMELKRVLTAHDPTSGGVRIRQQLFQPTAEDLAPKTAAPVVVVPKPPQPATDDDDDSDFDDSDLELDDMDTVFVARRQELEAQVKAALQNAADGYGIVLEAEGPQLLQELAQTPKVPRVVLVTSTAWDESKVQDMVREMGTVAKKFLGTKFYVMALRSGGASGEEVARELGLKSVPCLVALRNGEKVDSTALDEKCMVEAATRWEARLIPWLNMCNVLATTRQEKRGLSVNGQKKQMAREDDREEPPTYDCGVENCRIRYGFQHEHVGPSQESKSEISSWRTAA